VADERLADAVGEFLGEGPACANRAIRADRPSRGRGASDSRTSTSPDRAIRDRTSSSACLSI